MKKTRKAPRATKPARRPAAKRPAAARRPVAKRRPAAERRPVAPGEEHLGMAVADGFAMDRLGAPVGMRKRRPRAVREISWAAFGEVARALALRIGETFEPDAVVGIAKGGVFVGGALAGALGAEFYPVRIEKRRRDAGTLPQAATELPDLTGRRVLVVDDVASSGATLARARALARKAGAREVRTAVLVVRPGGARPDYSVHETDELVLFGWDYQLDGAGGGSGDPGEAGV